MAKKLVAYATARPLKYTPASILLTVGNKKPKGIEFWLNHRIFAAEAENKMHKWQQLNTVILHWGEKRIDSRMLLSYEKKWENA